MLAVIRILVFFKALSSVKCLSYFLTEEKNFNDYYFNDEALGKVFHNIESIHDCGLVCWNVPKVLSLVFYGASSTCRCHMKRITNLNNAVALSGARYYGYSDVLGVNDCNDIYRQHKESGVYRIFPYNKRDNGKLVYCDMDTDGGKWTVIQRRQNGTVNFFRNFDNYKKGFGNFFEDFYVGNEVIYFLTSTGDYELRIDLKKANGVQGFAKYGHFSIGAENTNFQLAVSDFDPNSTAGDSLSDANGQGFAAKDSAYGNNCANSRYGAWWYHSCSNANLNGHFLTPGTVDVTGIRWDTFQVDTSLAYADMKIRRKKD